MNGPGRDSLPSGRDLGEAIRGLRRERRMTIDGLAWTADIHPTYVSAIERGLRNPTWKKLCALAGALHVPVVEMAQRAESAQRVRQGLEHVLEEEEARSSILPEGSFADGAA
jgi:transcriptional regulator with XRE-family HTH domain